MPTAVIDGNLFEWRVRNASYIVGTSASKWDMPKGVKRMTLLSPTTAMPDHESSCPTERRKVKHQLNVRLLVGTLIVVAVLGPATYFWREFQITRTAGSFLSRADQLEKEAKWGEAAGHLFRYLQLRPDEANVRIRLAENFGKSAAKNVRLKSRAINLYYHALGVATEEQQLALRAPLADLLLESQQFSAAEKEAKKLLEGTPGDQKGLRLLALAHYGQHRPGILAPKSQDGISIGEEVEAALERDPGNVALARALAGIYRTEPLLLGESKQNLTENEREKLADGVINRMVETMLKKTPDDLDTLLLAAEHARQKAIQIMKQKASSNDAKKVAEKHLTAASEYYGHIVNEVAPQDERAYLGLGGIWLLRGKSDEAIKTWQKGLAVSNTESIQLNLCLAKALLAKGRIESAEIAVKALSDAVDKRIATLPRRWRLSLERSIHMLEGKCFAATGRHQEAIGRMKLVLAIRPSSAAEAAQAYQAEMLLGNAHASLNEWTAAAMAFERAVMLEPELLRPRVSAFVARATALDEAMAIRHYDMALNRSARAKNQTLTSAQRSERWYELAVACYQREAHLPKERRNWASLTTAMGVLMPIDGETSLTNAWRLAMLRASYLVVIGEENNREKGILDALKLLRQTEEQYATSVPFLQNLVLGYERLEAPEDADRVVEKLDSLTDKSVATYALRSNLHCLRRQYDKAREILTEGLATLPSSDHAALRQGLARVDLAEAQRRRLELFDQDQTNVEMISRFIDSAFEQRSLVEVRHWERALRDLEGDNSPHADYARVLQLLADTTAQKDARFLEGVELLSDIEQRLPNSPKIRMLRGMVLQTQGEPSKAIVAYQDAIRLGMKTASVYERLVALLGNAGQFDEAWTYLLQAKERGITSSRLPTLGIALAAGAKQLDRAEELARVAALKNPESASAKLNHAQILLVNKKPEEAEAAFREAIHRAPIDVRGYVALFSLYLQTGQKDLARQTLQQLEENVALGRSQLASVLAESYERLGNVEKAAANYREAQQLEPKNSVNQMRLADFLIRRDKKDEAETILRDVVSTNPRADAARYRLADILVARGGKGEWQEALKLLEQSGADADIFRLDRRLQALLLVRRAGRENIARAKELLEGLVFDTQNPSDAARLLLAQVYEAEIAQLRGIGDAEGAKDMRREARQQYVTVIERANPTPAHLALFVEFLTRNGEADAASRYLDRLEKLAPDSVGTTQLRARWLRDANRTKEIKPLVESLAGKLLKKIADDSSAEAQLALKIGNIYSGVALHREAEHWYRRLVALAPSGYAPLVTVLAKQSRMQDVIDVCTTAAQSDHSARPAALLASVLLTGKVSEDEVEQAEPLLKNALKNHPNDVELLLSLANLRFARKQMDMADMHYQRVIALDPKNLMALNNRATLLSEVPEKNEEALEMIDRAIELAGEQAAFLDTKAMILVYGGKPDQAIPLLEMAAYSAASDPRYHFHLAVALVRNGNLNKARAAMQAANRSDLRNQFLTEMDLRLLTELEEKLSN